MSRAAFSAMLGELAGGARLNRTEAREAMDAIMRGEISEAQIGAFLMALRVRGESTEEIAGAADSLRSHAVQIQVDRKPVIDTCGTGGDGAGTFNISTAAAFVVAGAGVCVAKHGNRSVSSKCGSADVLEALGARIDLPPEGVVACMEANGVGFMFAPHHHQAMKHAAGVRRDLAVRTLFNLLGPLCNPANLTHQMMGVYDPGLTETLATVLSLLGMEGAMVVHGSGLDEITLSGSTQVSEWKEGEVSSYTITPADLKLDPAPLEALKGGDAPTNAALIQDIFEDRTGPARDVVVANAGAAIYTAAAATSLVEGIEIARETVERGDASRTLQSFVAFTRDWRD